MENLQASYFIQNAREKLKGKNVRSLAVLHTGVTVAAGLAVTLLQFALTKGIGNTGGLAGMGTRSMLETLQTVLQWANMVLLPFWNLGFLYVAMGWARGGSPRKEDLLTGFYRIGPCLGLLLNRALMMIAVMVITMNLCSVVYAMTPAAQPLAEFAAQATTTQDMYAMMEKLTQQEAMDLLYSMVPMLVVWLLLCVAILVPLMYRFRLAEYAILNQKGVRAFPAMLISAALLRRRCWQLFKLDLKLWWYYGLKLLCTVLLYADLLLAAFGIVLPIGGDALFLLTYVVYLAALFGVEVSFRPHVETVYAGVYEALLEMGPAPKRTVKQPQNLPWDSQ